MRARSIERDILKAAGFGLLLAFGLAATGLLYACLMTGAQEIALASGGSAEEIAGVGIWTTSIMLLLGLAPMLRFMLAELPDQLASTLKLPRVQLRWLGLFGLGLAMLFLV